MGFFAARAIAGVELVHAGGYARTWRHHDQAGHFSVAPGEGALEVEAEHAPEAVLARIRFVFDLDRDPAALAQHFAADALLAVAIARRPGPPIPGGWDGLEPAVRAGLGQPVRGAA